MASANESTQAGEQTEPAAKPHVNPLLKIVVYLFAIPVVIAREFRKWLWTDVYYQQSVYDKKRYLSIPIVVLSTVLAVAAGIGIGWFHGWHMGLIWKVWVSAGVTTTILSFVYVYPFFHKVILQKGLEWAEDLWGLVDSRVDSGAWLTNALMFLSYFGIVCGSVLLWSVIYHIVHVKMTTPIIGWVVSQAVGIGIGVIVGAIAWAIVYHSRLLVAACASGAAVTYGLHFPIDSFLSNYELPRLFSQISYGVTFMLWMGYGFPIVYIIATRGLGRLRNIFDFLMRKWIDFALEPAWEKDNWLARRAFICQAANIAVAGLVFWAITHFVQAPQSLLWGIAGIGTFLTYLIGGKILPFLLDGSDSNKNVIGLAICLPPFFRIGWVIFTTVSATENWFIAGGVALLPAFLTFVVMGVFVYPFIYVLIGNPIFVFIGSYTIVPLYARVYKRCNELVHAFQYTYFDTTPYRNTFLQVSNVATTVGIYFASGLLCEVLGLTQVWLQIPITVVATIAAYLVLGMLLLKWGNWIVGSLISVASGVTVGTLVFAHQEQNAWLVSVPAGVAALAVTFFFVYPIAYVIVRFVANLLQVNLWLGAILTGVYNFAWRRASATWAEFVVAYNNVKTIGSDISAQVRQILSGMKR